MKNIFLLFFVSIVALQESFAQNIGIGTITPAAKLQINHRTTAASPTLRLFDSAAGTGSRLVFARENQSNSFTLLSTIDLFAINNSLDFRTTFNSGIFLRGDGRVGINNITNPAAILHVGGGVKINDTLNVTGDVNISGRLKINGNTGDSGQVLLSKGTSDEPVWGNITIAAPQENISNSIGYGVWGDCTTSQIVSEYQPDTDSSAGGGDHLGFSVSISGNFAIAGAYEEDGINHGAGRARIYKHNGERWVFFQTLLPDNNAAFNFYGYAVSMSGNYAVVGSYGDNNFFGAVYIYQFNGTNWVQVQKIIDATGETGAQFGKSVSISGSMLIVGSPMEDNSGVSNSGNVSFFRFNGSSWVLVQKIADGTGGLEDQFGSAVAISGNHAFVGAPLDDNGAQANAGSFSIYNYNGTSWQFMEKNNSLFANENLGSSLAVSGNYGVIGAPGVNSGRGIASIYRLFGASNWQGVGSISDPTGTAGDRMGTSVSINGNYAMAGSILGESNNYGNVVIHTNIGIAWQYLVKITDPGANSINSFGRSCAIDGATKRFVIGADQFSGSFGRLIFGKVN